LENPDLNIPRCFAVIAIDYQRSKSGFWQKRCVGSGSDVQKQRRVSLFLRCFRLFFSLFPNPAVREIPQRPSVSLAQSSVICQIRKC
jgi:hypothetical protein